MSCRDIDDTRGMRISGRGGEYIKASWTGNTPRGLEVEGVLIMLVESYLR